jgi:hypothetical protein
MYVENYPFPLIAQQRLPLEGLLGQLAANPSLCRFYVDDVECSLSWYCLVLVVLTGFSSVSQCESIGLLTGLLL